MREGGLNTEREGVTVERGEAKGGLEQRLSLAPGMEPMITISSLQFPVLPLASLWVLPFKKESLRIQTCR